MHAISVSPFALDLLNGPVQSGASLGHGHLLFGDQVLSLTAPGQPRMPNGIECQLPMLDSGAPVRVGQSRLESDFGTVLSGPMWDPRPRPLFIVRTSPRLTRKELLEQSGLGPGLTPLADDVLVGYLASAGFSGCQFGSLLRLASSAGKRTTALSATLLRLACCGYLPEPAHRVLEGGTVEPLLSWGASSGMGLLVGLGHIRSGKRGIMIRQLDLRLCVDEPRDFSVEVYKADG